MELDNEITNHYSKVPNKESNKLNNNLVHTGKKLYSTSPVSITKKGNDNMVNFAKDKVNTTNLDNVDKEKNGQFSFWLGLFKKAFIFFKKTDKNDTDYWEFFTDMFTQIVHYLELEF